MHRPEIIAQRVDAIREEAIRHAGIGIVVLQVTSSSLMIVDVNDALSSLLGYRPADLQGQPIDRLYGCRTDLRRAEEMASAARDSQPWKDTITLQDAGGVPRPVMVDMAPRTWSDVDGLFAIATLMDASHYERSRSIQRLLNDVTSITGRHEKPESLAAGIASAMVRDFADWCVIHLREADGAVRLAAIASRNHEAPMGDTSLDTEQVGIGQVIASGLPLLHQPSHRTNEPLHAQIQAIIGQPVHAVISAPIAATTLNTFGAITWAITDDKREYHHEDVQAAEEAGSKLGHYIEEDHIRESLARAVQAREGFMRAAGHELRTPLVSIKGYTQLLLRDFRRQKISPERLEAGLKAIDVSTSRLTDLMEDMFAVSTPGTYSLPLRLSTVETTQFIKEFLTTTPTLTLSEHSFYLDGPESGLRVSLDTGRFTQVIFNVVINAVQFSKPGTDIFITTSRQGDNVDIAVTDSGKGLVPGEETTIFDPFTHARSWEHSENQGLGIGLYISKQIVQRHGGDIWAASSGPGQGTTVHIRLPLADEDR